MKLKNLIAVFQSACYSRSEHTITKGQLRAGFRFSPRTSEAFPFPITQVTEKNNLYCAACQAIAHETSRQNTGVIQNQTITRI